MGHMILKKWMIALVITLLHFNIGVQGMKDGNLWKSSDLREKFPTIQGEDNDWEKSLEKAIKDFDDFEKSLVDLQLRQNACKDLKFKKAITLSDLQGEFYTSICESITVNGTEITNTKNGNIVGIIQDKGEIFGIQDTNWILSKTSKSLIWMDESRKRIWYKDTTKNVKNGNVCCSCKNTPSKNEQITFKKV